MTRSMRKRANENARRIAHLLRFPYGPWDGDSCWTAQGVQSYVTKNAARYGVALDDVNWQLVAELLNRDLSRLIANFHPPMHVAQRRSFAYSNANLSNPRITREMVDHEAERIPLERYGWGDAP